jgi:signal transduction histidine kinase
MVNNKHLTDTEEQDRTEQEMEDLDYDGRRPGKSIQPFRLVKYFSFTGFFVILVFTLVLSIFISTQTRRITQKKSDDYALLLADNLNHQVFLQFVIPTAMRYGRIRLRDSEQYNMLDTVVRNTIHSFNVQRVNIYDLEGAITYSTEKDLVGPQKSDLKQYKDALEGTRSSILVTEPGKSITRLDRIWTLRTFYPFRAEERLRGPVGEVLGVFEIYQDLTGDYAEITKFQFVSIAISIAISGLIFFILRQIIARGESIIEQRNDERRRLEEKLHQTERLANLGRMVAAVAHEIRNPLGIISSTAEILQNKIKVHEPNNRLAEVIVEEARRLNGIVTEFLDFARPQLPRPAPCRLEEVLDKNISYLGPELDKAGIVVEREYRGPETVEVDADLLYRAFLNIFVNSIQAMPQGGTISVCTSLPYGADGKSLGRAEICISDTGEGIDQEQAATLFSPFFTTKNRGSGLGLAIVKNIIDGHNGSVTIEPGPAGGTRLTIQLPTRQD